MNIKKIRTKIVLVVLFCSISLSVILLILTSNYSSLLMKSESEEKLMNLTVGYAKKLDSEFLKKKTVAENIEMYVRNTFDLDEFYKNDDYYDKYRDSIEPFIRMTADRYGDAWIYFSPYLKKDEVHDIWYFDLNRDGKTEKMKESNKDFYKTEINKDWFFKPMHEKKAYWTDPYPTSQLFGTGIWWISYSLPIFIDDTFIGAVGTDFIYQEFENEIRNLNIYKTGYAILTNSKYDFLIHPVYDKHDNLKTIDNGNYKWMSDYIDKREKGIIEYTWIDGDEKIMAFSKLYNGWVIAITASKKEIYNVIKKQLLYMITLVIIGSTITAFIVYYLSFKLTNSLEKVTSRIKLIGKGNYEIEIPKYLLKDISEVGTLAKSVEEMRIRQKKSFEEITDYNSNLEELVEMRTNELKEMNNELEISFKNLKATQELLVETQKFEAISHLLIEISHRMNTPLGNAKMSTSFVESLIKKIKDNFKENKLSKQKFIDNFNEMEKSIKIASSSIDISSELIRDLQNILVNTQTFDRNLVNMKIFLDSTFNYIKKRCSDKLTLYWSVDCDENIEFSIYTKTLVEVFENLVKYSLLNAINIEVNMIRVVAKLETNNLIIDYYDQSKPILAEDREHIFEPFTFNSFETGSSGLELHLAYTYIKRGLGGKILYLKNSDDRYYFRIILPSEK
ncbi:Cache 3/Cache 2 fusion domain-containing protein [Helicovermis profundi]